MYWEEGVPLLDGEALVDGYIVAPPPTAVGVPEPTQTRDYRPGWAYAKIDSDLFETARALPGALGLKLIFHVVEYTFTGRAQIPPKTIWSQCMGARAKANDRYNAVLNGKKGGAPHHGDGDGNP